MPWATAEVLEQARGDKIIIFKNKCWQNYRRKNGHKQELTVLRILDILADASQRPAAKKEKVKADPESGSHGRGSGRSRPGTDG